MMIRTKDEILTRIEAMTDDDDPLGFARDVLIDALDYDTALGFFALDPSRAASPDLAERRKAWEENERLTSASIGDRAAGTSADNDCHRIRGGACPPAPAGTSHNRGYRSACIAPPTASATCPRGISTTSSTAA